MVDNDDARLNHILEAAEEIERFLSPLEIASLTAISM